MPTTTAITPAGYGYEPAYAYQPGYGYQRGYAYQPGYGYQRGQAYQPAYAYEPGLSGAGRYYGYRNVNSGKDLSIGAQ